MVLEAKGVDGTVRFDGETVVIRYKGAVRFRRKLGRTPVEDIRIPLTDVATVHFQPSSLLWNGFVRFEVTGVESVTPPPESKPVVAVKYALRDRNSVVFSRYQDKEFAALRAAVDEARA